LSPWLLSRLGKQGKQTITCLQKVHLSYDVYSERVKGVFVVTVPVRPRKKSTCTFSYSSIQEYFCTHLCVCLLEFLFLAISVPEFAKSTFRWKCFSF
jgi:hypothetical protein